MTTCKKLLALILALSLLVLAGCGQDRDLVEQMQLDQEAEAATPDLGSDDEFTIFDGWWQRSRAYESDGTSLLDYFFVDGVSGYFTIYSPCGEELETFDCYVDDTLLTLELYGSQKSFYYDEARLFDAETGKEEYIGVITPTFQSASDAEENLDGTWYRLGDLEGNQIYELSSAGYQKCIEGDVVSEGSFEPANVNVFVGDYSPGQVLTLMLDESGLSLVPSMDRSMLLEEDGFDVYLYAGEEAAMSNSFEAFAAMEGLLNTMMATDVYDDGYCLEFYPSCFQVTECTPDGSGSILRGDTVIAGQWTVADDQIVLFPDGGTEVWADLPDEDFSFYFEPLDCWFYPV